MSPATVPRLSRVAVAAIAAAPLASPPAIVAAPGDLDSLHRAVDILDRAIEVMGGRADLSRLGGLRFQAEGVLNQGAERQGLREDSLDPAPFSETIGVRFEGGALTAAAYEYRHQRIDGSSEWLREIYPANDQWALFGVDAGWSVRFQGDHLLGKRLHVVRRVPQLLLTELRDNAASLRWMGRDGDVDVLAGALATGEVVTIGVGVDSGALRTVEMMIDAPTFGDAPVRWRLSEYEPVSGLGLFPRRYGVSIEGRPFTDMRITHVRTGAGDDLFRNPHGGALPEPIPVPPDMIDPDARAEVRTVTGGVHLVTNLRNGFHPIFFEFEDFVVAVDAPAGYRLLNEIPPGYVAHGATSSSLSERYIELIKETAPGKPIRYVVLTHFHNDHAGGLRAFVAEGAAVIAPAQAARAIMEFMDERHAINPDRLTRDPAPLALETITSVRTISDGSRTLRVIPMGENPHVDGMLVVHDPGADLVYCVDMVYPGRLENFPSAAHRETALFFIRWLDARGLDPDDVYTAHGAARATRDHLDKLRRLAGEADRPPAQDAPD